MKHSFTGLLLVEGLEDEGFLSRIAVTKRETWDVGDRAADFQPRTWNAVFFEGDAGRIGATAQALSRVTRYRWYANLSDELTEYVVFRDRVFTHRKGDRTGAKEAVEHGRSQGIPEHQLDWVGEPE